MIFLLLLFYPYLLASSTHAGLFIVPLILFFILSGQTSYIQLLKKQDWRLWGISGIALLSLILGGSDASHYEIIRDIYYFVKPLLFIYTGMLLFEFLKKDYRRLLQYIVIAIAVQTVVFLLLRFIQAPFVFSIEDRDTFGNRGIEVYLPFVICALALRKGWPLFSRKLLFLFALLGLIGSLLSLGRTYYAILAISIVLLLINRRKIYISCCIMFLIGSLCIIVFGEQLGEYFYSEADDYTRLSDKIQNSFCEILPYERTDVKINTDWRGHEAYLGLQMFYEGTLFQQIFGQGLGAICYNNIFEDGQLSALPIFHNGYITILLKTGWCGILLFILFLIHLMKMGKNSCSAEADFAATLTILLVCCVLIMTQVIHGIFTSSTQFFLMLLIGSHIAYFRDVEKEKMPVSLKKTILSQET